MNSRRLDKATADELANTPEGREIFQTPGAQKMLEQLEPHPLDGVVVVGGVLPTVRLNSMTDDELAVANALMKQRGLVASRVTQDEYVFKAV